MIPSLAQLSKAMEGYFVVEDLHNLGPHYDPTLIAWYHNFDQAWPELKKQYDERFYRMWRFYLLSSAGGFRAPLPGLAVGAYAQGEPATQLPFELNQFNRDLSLSVLSCSGISAAAGPDRRSLL